MGNTINLAKIFGLLALIGSVCTYSMNCENACGKEGWQESPLEKYNIRYSFPGSRHLGLRTISKRKIEEFDKYLAEQSILAAQTRARQEPCSKFARLVYQVWPERQFSQNVERAEQPAPQTAAQQGCQGPDIFCLQEGTAQDNSSGMNNAREDEKKDNVDEEIAGVQNAPFEPHENVLADEQNESSSHLYEEILLPDGWQAPEQLPFIYEVNRQRGVPVIFHGQQIGIVTAKTFICLQCNARYAHRSGLVLHSKSHRPEHLWEFVCNRCGKRFYRKCLRNEHERSVLCLPILANKVTSQ